MALAAPARFVAFANCTSLAEESLRSSPSFFPNVQQNRAYIHRGSVRPGDAQGSAGGGSAATPARVALRE